MIKRIGIARTNRLGDLALHEPRECTCLEPHELWTKITHNVRGAGEQQIADQDRNGVTPAGVGARRAATYSGLVHDVVVVQARHVSELDDHRCLDHILGGLAWPEIRAKDHEQGPEALATSGDDVLRSFGHHLGVRLGGPEQSGVDQLKLGADRGLENLVLCLFSQHHSSVCSQSRLRLCRQRMNSPACWASANSGPGNIPKATVTTTPTPTAASVVQLGRTTLVVSFRGSAKNISTITRM